MVREFDWITAYDWEKLDAKKFSRERDLSNICDEIFEGSLKSAQLNLPKTVSFYTWWREVDAGSTRKILMYVLSFTDGDLRGEKRSNELDNFVKLAPNLRNIAYESPNPYIAGTEYDDRFGRGRCPWAPSLAKAFQRISRKGTVTSLNYPFGFYNEERVNNQTTRTLVSLDAESFWGNLGSGVLVVARDTQRILLGLRSLGVEEPNTWGNFGGAIGISDDGEPEEALSPEGNALKEMSEEINYRGPIEMIPSFTYRNNSFTYYNYIGMVNSESQIALNQFNWEISELRWFTLDEVLSLSNLHFGISELLRQEEMVTFNAPGIADEEYRTFFNKDFELTNEPQFVLFEELPVITQDDIVYMATHPTWGNPILAEEYAYCHPNYFKRDLQGIEFPTFNANMNDINFPLTQRNRHTPTILKYLEQLQTSNAPPILISGNEFIDGGHRFLAYELAGRRTIPVVDIGNLLTGEGDTTELIHQFSAEDNAQNITYDEFGQPYITLYHAGTMDNHELISITGLRTNLPGWDPKTEFETFDNEEGIYFTTNLDKAIKWIGWKYRQEFCEFEEENLDETELAPYPNEVAGVVYAVQFPLIIHNKKYQLIYPEDLSKDEIVEDAWVSKQSIPIDELEVVGFYSLPICFWQGWNDWDFGITELTKSEAMDIHNRGFTMERVEWSLNSGDYEPIFDSKYKPRYHLTLPRDSMYSSYKGWFAAESVPMADWDTLSPIELVDLITFPSDDGHGDAWDMYIPRDWPHHAVLDKAEDEITQRLRALPQGFHPKERRKIFDETYSKYFDFWYIPGTEYSMTGGGYQELTQSIQDNYENDYFKEEAEKRGIPFDTNLSLEEARKYLPKSTVDWAEKNNRLPRIYAQAIVKAIIQDYLDLGRDKIFYTPLLAAAPMEAEVGTDASKGAGLVAGWHRDAYANLLYDQDPSYGFAPTVFFKPKEEYL